MMKRLLAHIGIALLLVLGQSAFAGSGLLFNVTASGTPGNVSVNLCLNGKGPLSCQDYNLSALTLNISPTVPNHVYPAIGIKINTPGYTLANLGIDCAPNTNGYCLFSASQAAPKTIIIKSSTTPTANTVGGSVTGLTGTVTLLNNGTNATPISTDGPFTFSLPIAQGSPYAVTVGTQPSGQTCIVSNETGTMGGTNVTNVAVTCAATPTTTITVSATGIIPYTGGVYTGGNGSLTVTNGGANTAYNVKATLPGGWTGVTQDATGCATISPNGGTCTLVFTSTTPYVAQGNITVTGDNITTPPTTALAFSVGGYLVWSVDSTSSVSVIDTADLSSVQWGNAVTTNAQSLTDGFGNTSTINGTSGITPSAAVNCYNSTVGGATAGTWYLPAVCQMGGAGQGAGCSSGSANIDTNLVQLGFGGLAGLYWSSPESSASPQYAAWIEYFASGGSSQNDYGKDYPFGVRCSRALSL